MNLCGICRRAPRIGEGHRRLRLGPDEAAAMGLKLGHVIQVGLYQCCEECWLDAGPLVGMRVMAAMGLTNPEQLTDNHLI